MGDLKIAAIPDQPAGDENFGARMNRIKRERGLPIGGPGRPKLAEKYQAQIAAAERVFAKQLPVEAVRYVAELAPKEPETCPRHGRVLTCPVEDCGHESERTVYDFRAATYAFDRIMGRPTSRSENTLTLQFVEQLTGVFVAVFQEVNRIDDARERNEAFAERCAEVGAQFSGT